MTPSESDRRPPDRSDLGELQPGLAGRSRADLFGTLAALAPMWRELAAPLVASHRDAGAVLLPLVQRAAAGLGGSGEPESEGPDSGGSAPRPSTGTPLDDAISTLGTNAAGLVRRARAGSIATEEVRRKLSGSVAALHGAGREAHTRGWGPPTTTGTVHQLNIGGGGVPKQSVDAAEITPDGVAGDRQASRSVHGRPMQALSLWAVEVIDALRAEGHAVFPGAAGENLTLAGLDWTDLRPGVRVALGDDVRAEISVAATPCKKQARWFRGGDFRRIDHDRHPGWSRLYAWVLCPGVVRPGDAVVIEPD